MQERAKVVEAVRREERDRAAHMILKEETRFRRAGMGPVADALFALSVKVRGLK
jgi:hypothetical protein